MQGVYERGLDGSGAPLQRDSLQQQIYDRLHDSLVSGAFLPGEIVSSRGLAQSLGVSAMPVREALTRLTAEGALKLTSSRTLRVRVLTPADFDELTTIRVELEGMAAERAAGQATDEDAASVAALHQALATAADSADVDRYLAANAAFHTGLYAAARWPMLLSIIQRLWLTVGPSIRASVPDAQHMATSMTFHDRAIAALRAHDATALRAAIVGDIRAAATDIRASLADEDGAGV